MTGVGEGEQPDQNLLHNDPNEKSPAQLRGAVGYLTRQRFAA